MARRLLCSLFILSLFLVSMTWVPTINTYASDKQQNEKIDSSTGDNQQDDLLAPEEEHSENGNSFIVSENGPYNGILNPVTIEQVGFTSSGTLAARTDNGINTEYSLPLDDTHSWVGSRVDLDVTKLSKLFALNGSFSEGTVSGETFYPNGSPDYFPYGWGAISATDRVDPDVIQRVAYEDTGREYIVVETKAELTNNPQHIYTHYNETTVYWNQSINISPGTSDFILSFDYLYLFGPINGSGPDLYTGSVYIEVIFDGNLIYSLNLADLTQRNSWSSTGQIPISLTPTQNPTMFMIGIKVNKTFTLDADFDYDYTPGADGASNAEYITVYLDDVSFTAATPPSFEQVDLQLTVEGQSTPVVGTSGIGSAAINNSSYWTVDPVILQLTSNTTVSFEYEAILRTHRYSNSTWMTDNTKFGVQYTVVVGESPELSFNTYIGFIGGYINLTTRAWFPSDWENITVFDPFLVDVTSSCDVIVNMVEIPTSLMDRLGWWKFNLDSPNYAKSIKSQIFDSVWTDETEFRIGNMTRANITIGTDTQTLGSLIGVNVSWFKPSNEVWISEILPTGGALGQIYSTSQTFLSGSSPAGQWYVEVHWKNGTEVAYDRVTFKVFHSANLAAEPSLISTTAGSIIKGIVRYTDGDTGTFLMDPSVTLVGNWSGSMIPFNANPIQNWWEADFDTTVTGAGEFVIVVNAFRPFYDNISCQITVQSILVTRLTSPNAPWTSEEWGHGVTLTYVYEYYDSITKTWGPVTSSVSASVNWSGAAVTEDSPGIFTVDLDTSIMNSGTYLINATFSKLHHQSKQLLLTLIISQTTSSLRIDGEISARVNISQPYPIKISYTYSDGSPITGANLIVDSVSPPFGLQYTSVSEVGGEPGNFTLTLTPQGAGVFTVRFEATSQNAEPASTVFVLVVNDVGTRVDIPPDSVEIGLTDTYNTTFRYEMLNTTGIDNAAITIIYSGGTLGALTWEWVDIGNGDYSVEFSSIESGTYLVTIAAYKQYYERATDAFFLIVGAINASLVSLNGTGNVISFGKDFELFVSYTNGSGYGLDGANVSVASVSPETGLNCSSASSHGQGIYSILLTPLEDNLFTLLIRADLSNHDTGFTQFALNVNPIATTLSILNSSASISLDQNFTVYLLFQDEDLNILENATISIQNPPLGISATGFEELGNGIYSTTLSPFEVGTFDFIFKASKAGYQNDTNSFTLSAKRVPTTLRIGDSPSPDSIIYNGVYEIVVFYERDDIGQNVSDATISVQSPIDSLALLPPEMLDNGYRITFTPLKTGNWTVYIFASKDDYEESSIPYRLEVMPITISVEFVSILEAVEGTTFNVTIKLTESGTGKRIDKADVTYRFTPSRIGRFSPMNETGISGEYYATLFVPLFADPVYRLEIKAEKDYHNLTQLIDETFVILINPIGRNAMTITASSGIGGSLVLFFVALRIYSRRKKKHLDIDLKNKRRFDDADNMIGVIVLHKKSGIPIYSRIPKGGFDEGIVAAFVSAVTHFREEFEMFDEEQMQVIPISDIIRAVQTRNLICAFVTVRSASIDQNRKMESYGMQVGTYLDDLFEEQPRSLVDEKIVQMLDYIFDSTMDGHLLRFYKKSSTDAFPKRYHLLDKIMTDLETRHCSKPVYLAQGIATYGVSQSRGCTLVLEAIDKKLIQVCDKHEIPTSEMEFKEYFRGSEARGVK
ncbi:MAG: hypothetical protein ACFFCX_11385 [Candidatus Sifarchaeia archaeon]